MYVRIRVIAAHFLVVLALVLVQTNPATARVTSLVDDLYKLVIKSPKYRHISYSKFTKSLRTAKLTKYADEILSFPKAEGIALQLEIAEQRGLVEGTSIIRFARTYNKIPDGDRLLLQVIDQGDRRLLDLVPSYGDQLISRGKEYEQAGVSILRHLDKKGMELFTKLPKEQIPDLAQQAKAIGGLSKAERGGVLGAIANYPVGALKFLKENPGLLYSTVGLTAFYAFIDTLGKAVPVKQYINLAFLIPLVALGVWFGIKLWGTWQAKKIDLENRKST